MSIAELYEKRALYCWWPMGLKRDPVKFGPVDCDWWIGGQGLSEEQAESLIFAALHASIRSRADYVRRIEYYDDKCAIICNRSGGFYGKGGTDLSRLVDAAEKANLL